MVDKDVDVAVVVDFLFEPVRKLYGERGFRCIGNFQLGGVLR